MNTSERPVICGETRYWTFDPRRNVYRKVVWFCRRPDCPKCGKMKSKRQSKNILRFVGNKPVHHVTLTLATAYGPLKPAVTTLFAAFRSLKRRARFKREVTAGVRFLHIKFDAYHQRWNTHLHLVVETHGLSIDWLRDEWAHITGGSWRVDDRAVAEGDDKIAVVKYASKFAYTDIADDPNLMAEYGRAMKGKRPAQVFGSWYGRLRLSA